MTVDNLATTIAARPLTKDDGHGLRPPDKTCYTKSIVGDGVNYSRARNRSRSIQGGFFMQNTFLDSPVDDWDGNPWGDGKAYEPPTGHWERTKRCACADSGCRLTDPAQPCPAIADEDAGIEHWRLAKLIAAPDNEEIAKELRRVLRECTPFDWLWIRVYDKDEAA